MKICRNLRRNGYRENLSVSFFLVFLLYRKNSNPLKTFGTEVEYLTTSAKATFQQPPQLSMIKQKKLTEPQPDHPRRCGWSWRRRCRNLRPCPSRTGCTRWDARFEGAAWSWSRTRCSRRWRSDGAGAWILCLWLRLFCLFEISLIIIWHWLVPLIAAKWSSGCNLLGSLEHWLQIEAKRIRRKMQIPVTKAIPWQ